MGKAKAARKDGIRNANRRSGKAWKRRPCGVRHAPDDCKTCK